MILTKKVAWCFVLVGALMFAATSRAQDPRKGAAQTRPAHDIRTIMSIVHAPRREWLARVLRIRAEKTLVTVSDVKQALPSRRTSILWDGITYHLGKHSVEAVEATAYRGQFPAIQEAYKIVTEMGSSKKARDKGKVRVEIKRPGRPSILAVVDTPTRGKSWGVRFTPWTGQSKASGRPSGRPNAGTGNQSPRADTRPVPLVVAGIPVLLGTPIDKVHRSLKKHGLAERWSVHVQLMNSLVSIGHATSIPARDITCFFLDADGKNIQSCALSFTAGKFAGAARTNVLRLWKLIKAVKAMGQVTHKEPHSPLSQSFVVRMRLPGAIQPTDVSVFPSLPSEDSIRLLAAEIDVSEMEDGDVNISLKVVKGQADAGKKPPTNEK